MQRSDTEFQKEVIKIFRAPGAEEEKGTEVAVIRWIKDGRAFPPSLEVREIYTDRLDGKRRHGKLRGIRWADWKFITETPERIEEVAELLLDLPMAKKRKSDVKARAAGEEIPAAPEAPKAQPVGDEVQRF
jgi:hypothetical protein